MTSSQENEDFEQVVEKIVFDEEELEELKITIRNFTEGKIQAKQLKQKLLQNRGRMVKDISNFLSFCVDRIRNEDQTSKDQKLPLKNHPNQIQKQLKQDLIERNELLKDVANTVNRIVSKKEFSI